MISRRISSFCLLAVVAVVSCKKEQPPVEESSIAAPPKMARLEGYPASMIALLTNPASRGSSGSIRLVHFQQVVSTSRRWIPGSTITVAFQGGSPQLRAQIAQAIGPWVNEGNIHFDFGPSASTGHFREWTNADQSYAADIRIAFLGGDDGGYWSLVGKDSINPSTSVPNQASMNFDGFTSSLPPDWRATVLHEFGHALGFEHEHQIPTGTCEDEFRWDDDLGYMATTDSHGQFISDGQGKRPGIYTELEGPPNKWKKDQIDFNLRKLPYSADLILTTFDKLSIMEYHFEAWMYKNGPQSTCFTATENMQLSTGDITAVQTIYPRGNIDIKVALNKQQDAIQQLVRLGNLSAQVRAQYAADIADIKTAKRQ